MMSGNIPARLGSSPALASNDVGPHSPVAMKSNTASSLDGLLARHKSMMNPNNIIGVREFHYQVNKPVKVRYIIVDERLLKELNERYDFNPFDIQSVPPGVFQEYRRVMRFRDTQIFDPAIQAALKKIQEGITELVMLRLLAGEDPYTLTEGTLDAIEGSW